MGNVTPQRRMSCFGSYDKTDQVCGDGKCERVKSCIAQSAVALAREVANKLSETVYHCPNPSCNKEELVKSDNGPYLVCWRCGYRKE